MRPMPLTDALFLLAEARQRPMHVGGLQLFRPPTDAGPHHVGEVYRDAVEQQQVKGRLRLRPVSTLPLVGPWGWQDDTDLDLQYHVRHSALPHPGRIRELLALTSRLHGTLLDRSRPLWEMHLIEGLADGRFATYTKIHHALVDGVSATRMLERALSTDPHERGMPPPFAHRAGRVHTGVDGRRGASPLHLARNLAAGGLAGARGLIGASEAVVRSAVRSVSDQAAALPYQAPVSPLNVSISGARRFAADAWPIDRLRTVANRLDATLNDVVLGMCAGALRRYLIDLQGLPDDPLVAMVPVSLRPEADTTAGDDEGLGAGNAVGLVLCNLGTHLADAGERIALISRSMQVGKLQLDQLTPLGALMLSAVSVAPLALGPLSRFERLRKPPFNLIISNVTGPRERLHWNGAELDGMYPLSIPVDGQALNITVSSYAGQMGFGLTGCRRSVPQLQRLLDDLEGSLVELEQAAEAGPGDPARSKAGRGSPAAKR